MRHGEIRKLQWSHVDRAAGVFRLLVSITKTRTARVVPITPQVWQSLGALPRHLHGYVITYKGKPIKGNHGVRDGFGAACKAAGVVYGRDMDQGVILHDLRRTAKTNMLKSGMPKEYRDLILGHSLQGMDAHYISEDQLEKELIRAMGQYGVWLEAQLQLPPKPLPNQAANI